MLKASGRKEDNIISGTKAGSIKAVQTILERHGGDFFQRIGSKGGKACVPKGFSMNKKLASEAGVKGGIKSRRTS
jgi:general stress protein YciG